MAKKVAVKKKSKAGQYREYKRKNPGASIQEIADHFGTLYQNVYVSLRKTAKQAKADASEAGIPMDAHHLKVAAFALANGGINKTIELLKRLQKIIN
jgi:hypothetical protein